MDKRGIEVIESRNNKGELQGLKFTDKKLGNFQSFRYQKGVGIPDLAKSGVSFRHRQTYPSFGYKRGRNSQRHNHQSG